MCMISNERCYASIQLSQIKENYKILQGVARNAHVCAVVKANAYGHGATQVSLALQEAGCHFFAVASLEEAIEIRKAGISGDILIFGRTDIEHASILHKYNLIQTIHHLDYAVALSKKNSFIRCHINVDTGMSRFGIYLHHDSEMQSTIDEIKQIQQLHNIQVEGIYTHFADADNEDPSFTEQQFQLFSSLLKELKANNIDIPIQHACNSSATIRFPHMHLNMVRCGIAMYGYPQVKTRLELLPCMNVYAKVSDLRMVHPGDTVSYVRKHEAKQDELVATIAIGYADGYLRANTNKDYFLYKGKHLHQVGKVCMDAMMVNATGTDLKIGEFIEIFGMNKTASVVAKHTHTIEYEVLTNLSSRVKRIYR